MCDLTWGGTSCYIIYRFVCIYSIQRNRCNSNCTLLHKRECIVPVGTIMESHDTIYPEHAEGVKLKYEKRQEITGYQLSYDAHSSAFVWLLLSSVPAREWLAERLSSKAVSSNPVKPVKQTAGRQPWLVEFHRRFPCFRLVRPCPFRPTSPG